MSLLPFWALNVVVPLLSMQGQKALGLHQKYLNLCSEDEQSSYRCETTWGWVINDMIFIFGWTIPLKCIFPILLYSKYLIYLIRPVKINVVKNIQYMLWQNQFTVLHTWQLLFGPDNVAKAQLWVYVWSGDSGVSVLQGLDDVAESQRCELPGNTSIHQIVTPPQHSVSWISEIPLPSGMWWQP